MLKNMSTTDRIIRVLIFILAAYLFIGDILASPWGLVALIAGSVLLLTSMINFCPIYKALGISTRKSKS